MRKYKITLPKDYNIRAICNLLKPYPHVSIWGGSGEYWLELDNEKDYNEIKELIANETTTSNNDNDYSK